MPSPYRSSARAPLARRIVLLTCTLGCSFALSTPVPGPAAPSLVIAAVDDSQRVTLDGSVHPAAQPRFDAGPVPDKLPMLELALILRRSPKQDAALAQLMADQQARDSGRYHHWLTPAEFGMRFGASDSDLEIATRWLESHGFTVGHVPPGRARLPFFGTAGQVEGAFHTQIHFFDVKGKKHFANVANPEIPAAFAPLVVGIRGLHDFRPQPQARLRLPRTQPAFTYDGYDYVGPGDFATIYNLNPLYDDKITGAGVSIAIVAQSDVDATTPPLYWADFGISVTHSVTYLTPYGDPGYSSDDEVEADLDLEVAGGLAPSAQLILVASTSAVASAEYAIDQNLAAILSMSFGDCELSLGTGGNAEVNADFEQAAAQGITVIVSAGDSGSAGCDSDTQSSSIYGLGVNGLASTPYDVALGGTDFNPLLVQQGNYWSASNAPGSLDTALSYIPEMVWNDSCTNPVYIAEYSPDDSDPIAFCNNSTYGAYFDVVTAGSGGLSAASTLNGSSYQGYAQPSWQSGVAGIQSFGARAIPDVSLLATSWVICTYASSSCNPTAGDASVVGGTSAAAPAFAAIVALLDQTQISSGNPDGRQGLLNPLLYEAAAREYGSAANPNTANLKACSASAGSAVATTCVFYDVTVGNNSMPCSVQSYQGEPGATTSAAVCATDASSDTYGVLELNSNLAYAGGVGYDLASGLGSVNAANLVFGNTSLGAPTSLSATLKSGTATLHWTADPTAPANSTYNIYQGTAPGAEGAAPVKTGITSTTATVSGLTAGGQSYYFRVAAVSGGKVSYLSNEASVTNAPAAATGIRIAANGTQFTVTWSASFGATSYSIYFGSSSGGESSTPDPSGISTTSQSFAGLAGATYYLNVVAANSGGASPRSAEASVTLAPISPAGVYAATPTTSSVTLNWSPSYGATSYSLYEGTTPGGESATAVQTGITGTSALVTGLTAGREYFFVLTASNAAGSSARSDEAAAQMAPASQTSTSESSFFATVGTNSGGGISEGTVQSGSPTQPIAANSTVQPLAAPTALPPAAAVDAAATGTGKDRPIEGTADARSSSASSDGAAVSTVPPASGGGALGLVELLFCAVLVMGRVLRARGAGSARLRRLT